MKFEGWVKWRAHSTTKVGVNFTEAPPFLHVPYFIVFSIFCSIIGQLSCVLTEKDLLHKLGLSFVSSVLYLLTQTKPLPLSKKQDNFTSYIEANDSSEMLLCSGSPKIVKTSDLVHFSLDYFSTVLHFYAYK